MSSSATTVFGIREYGQDPPHTSKTHTHSLTHIKLKDKHSSQLVIQFELLYTCHRLLARACYVMCGWVGDVGRRV